MAVESREEFTVLLHFKDWDDAKACSTRPNADEPVRHIESVCPHCGKPWPLVHGGPYSEDYYKVSVQTEARVEYCCDKTRLDCEAKKRPVVKPEDVECPFSKSEPDL